MITTEITERKNIIDSFKSSYGKTKKGIKKRIQSIAGLLYVNIILAIISAGFVIATLIFDASGYEILKWQASGLLVLL
tara:strand:- start:881 stop:1114 length:234 start_codon:yes stop_codon:yes gene_type:complete